MMIDKETKVDPDELTGPKRDIALFMRDNMADIEKLIVNLQNDGMSEEDINETVAGWINSVSLGELQ